MYHVTETRRAKEIYLFFLRNIFAMCLNIVNRFDGSDNGPKRKQ